MPTAGEIMRVYPYTVQGEETLTHVPQDAADLAAFRRWFEAANARGPIALDTETTGGFTIYTADYGLRTVQFGDARDAWVIHFERGGAFAEAAAWALRAVRRVLIHNAPFDWLVLDHFVDGISLEGLFPKTLDTLIPAKLIDPRADYQGGVGHKLKPLAAHYVDPSAPDTQEGLTRVFNDLGYTKETGWRHIPLDHPTYNLYAGLDCILLARLAPLLRAEFQRLSIRRDLVPYEHELARICAVMRRAGMLVDTDYYAQLSPQLEEEYATHAAIAARYGVENVSSVDQVAAALSGMPDVTAHDLRDRTKTGHIQVDKAVLLPLADLDLDWNRIGAREPNPLANAVLHAKRANKWRKAYAEHLPAIADPQGRVHPNINTLSARTGRMSVADGFHQLPSGDHVIRRGIMGDPGEVVISCDFQAIEMRVLAALADVSRMKTALAHGEDLHDFTAQLVYGPGFTKHHRKICKIVGLGKVYGSGLDTLVRQTGAPASAIRRTIAEYGRIYPEIRAASRLWQREAAETGYVHLSATGRRLPVDKGKMFRIVNYMCQSTARDVLGQCLLDADDAGLTPYLRLPIHDELLCFAPRGDADEVAHALQRCMTMTLFGVPIVAKAKVGGRSWGSLYGATY